MDLSTSYLGFHLPHPFVAGAGPLADTVDGARAAEDAGAAAIVLRSLFEEQIDAEALATVAATESHAEAFGEALSFFPEPAEFVLGPEEYLEHLRRVKEAVDIPVIASLNGYTLGGWLGYARAMGAAGADALELNLYQVPTDPRQSAAALEERSLEMVREVKRSVPLPLAVKLSPFYTSLANFAALLEKSGADALVIFNRFFEPDLDLEELEIQPILRLSDSRELLLRLRWLAILSAALPNTRLAVSGGVHTVHDAVKAVMSGASAVQVVSALLQGGARRLKALRQGMSAWMEEHEYQSLDEMRGSMNLARCPDPTALSRANYMRMLLTWSPGST